MKPFHTRVTHVYRTGPAVKVVVGHRMGLDRKPATEARKQGQAKWAIRRLWERGQDLSGLNLVEACTSHDETKLTFMP